MVDLVEAGRKVSEVAAELEASELLADAEGFAIESLFAPGRDAI